MRILNGDIPSSNGTESWIEISNLAGTKVCSLAEDTEISLFLEKVKCDFVWKTGAKWEKIRDVYDIEVADNHNYFANGMLVSNSGWSHIKLDHPVPSPIQEEPIRRLLGITEKQMRGVIAGTESINGQRGPEALKQALSQLNLDDMQQKAQETIRLGRKTKRDDAVRQLNFITGLKKAGIRPEEMMISKVPVIPPTYRPVSKMGDMLLTSDANYLYKDLMTARDAHRHNSKELPQDELGDERLAIYDALKAVQGMGDPINVETANKGVKGFIKSIAGVGGPTTGFFNSKVIGHPVNAVGRSVIIPDSNLDMDHVGIPEEQAWEMFSAQTMRRMVQEGMPSVDAARRIEDRDPFAKKYLLKAMETNPVMISRDPALHRFSIMGSHAVMVPGNSIRLSPLVVKPFGADFDGDQMNVHVPISEEAKKEVLDRMLPSQNLLSIKDRKVHFLPAQEAILGNCLATTPNKKKQTVRFKTREEALDAYRKRLIDIDTPITIG